MTDEFNNSIDIESALRSISLSEGQLRLFACECCGLLVKMCDEPMFNELVEFGRSRSVGAPDPNKMRLLRERSGRVYDSLYPGYGAPSVACLALSAAGEAAFTASSVVAAINASNFAAQAVAAKACQSVDDDNYDASYDSAFRSERQRQLSLLRKHVPSS